MNAIVLRYSAVILAGGFSRRFGSDKGLVSLMGKPLVRHVVDKIPPVFNEILIVVSSEQQKKNFEFVVGNDVKYVIDKDNRQSPLIGSITGFENAIGDYSVLLPCDAPLISTRIIQLLLDLCNNRTTVIPRWPNGYIEPLQAVYHTESALIAAKKAFTEGHLNMRSMIKKIAKVHYVSTTILEIYDPDLLTFFNVNTPQDLLKASENLG